MSFGEQAAQISLNEQGHLNVYIKQKGTPGNFINSFLAHIWTHYFDEGIEKIEIEELEQEALTAIKEEREREEREREEREKLPEKKKKVEPKKPVVSEEPVFTGIFAEKLKSALNQKDSKKKTKK